MYVDGGVRSGLHVLTALALGAEARLPRPAAALRTGGRRAATGVTRLLAELAGELVEALRLAGGAADRRGTGRDDLLPRRTGFDLLGSGKRL